MRQRRLNKEDYIYHNNNEEKNDLTTYKNPKLSGNIRISRNKIVRIKIKYITSFTLIRNKLLMSINLNKIPKKVKSIFVFWLRFQYIYDTIRV